MSDWEEQFLFHCHAFSLLRPTGAAASSYHFNGEAYSELSPVKIQNPYFGVLLDFRTFEEAALLFLSVNDAAVS